MTPGDARRLVTMGDGTVYFEIANGVSGVDSDGPDGRSKLGRRATVSRLPSDSLVGCQAVGEGVGIAKLRATLYLGAERGAKVSRLPRVSASSLAGEHFENTVIAPRYSQLAWHDARVPPNPTTWWGRVMHGRRST